MPAKLDLTGQVFGRLTAMRQIPGTRLNKRPTWECRCSCGITKIVLTLLLRNGKTTSCGCLKREQTTARNTTHGLSQVHPSEYHVWKGIRKRCLNPREKAYENYGKRGIHVAASWSDFTAFMLDMGPRPTPKHTIERVDNDGHYSKDNCVWATRLTQANNTRRTRRLTLNGKSQSVMAWSKELNIPYRRILSRLHLGWSVKRSLSEPRQK